MLRERELCSEMTFAISRSLRHGILRKSRQSFRLRESTIYLCLVALSEALFPGQEFVQGIAPFELNRGDCLLQLRDLSAQPFYLGGKR